MPDPGWNSCVLLVDDLDCQQNLLQQAEGPRDAEWNSCNLLVDHLYTLCQLNLLWQAEGPASVVTGLQVQSEECKIGSLARPPHLLVQCQCLAKRPTGHAILWVAQPGIDRMHPPSPIES